MRTNFFSNRLNSRYFMKYAGILLIFFIGLSQMTAQATLSVQGILKKSNGVALEDGEYAMTFKLYAVDGTPAGVLWDETIPNVELNGGIYSVVLGLVDPLTVPFDQDYELSVSVGASEMLPKIKLTSAPYALSLRGQSNQFPSTGLVLADTIKVANGVSASRGEPSNNNVIDKGYSFNSDNDTGLFSPQNGQASIYINGVEKIGVTSSGASINGDLTLKASGTINYTNSNNQTISGWRLVEVDDFTTSSEDWLVYAPLTTQWTGWNNGTSEPIGVTPGASFIGNVLYPDLNRKVLKKKFTIPPGPWTQIKVKFRYYFVDSWDEGSNHDMSFAGFANDAIGGQFRVCWAKYTGYLELSSAFTDNNTAFRNAENFLGLPDSDYGEDVEMAARRNGSDNEFYVYIGASLSGNNTDESYAIGPVEIWVR